MKTKDPAFLFYPKDWLGGTAEYMPDEKGVYIDLLCHQHQKGSLPEDTERLARMVGLPHDSFLKIWSVVSQNFEQTDNRTDNRLVNRKLFDLMQNRAEKGLKNTITGTFAGLLRSGKYTKTDTKTLKDAFDYTLFLRCDKDTITERITEWITERLASRLKSIGNGNNSLDKDNTEHVYSPFYDFELKRSDNDANYEQLIKVLFGDNNLKKPLKSVLSMPEQLSYEQFKKLFVFKQKYGVVFSEILEQMENWKDLKDRKTLQLTFMTFMKRRHPEIKEQ